MRKMVCDLELFSFMLVAPTTRLAGGFRKEKKREEKKDRDKRGQMLEMPAKAGTHKQTTTKTWKNERTFSQRQELGDLFDAGHLPFAQAPNENTTLFEKHH